MLNRDKLVMICPEARRGACAPGGIMKVLMAIEDDYFGSDLLAFTQNKSDVLETAADGSTTEVKDCQIHSLRKLRLVSTHI
jgi:uncharacterized protein YbbK (DUF523 family)